MHESTPATFRLGKWRLDLSTGHLESGTEQVHLEPRLTRILELLIAGNGELVSRTTLFDGVWPNQEISDQTLDSGISRLRNKLGDDPKAPTYIQTVPKRGYRLLQVAVIDNGLPNQDLGPMPIGPSAPDPPRPVGAKYWMLAAFVLLAVSVAAWRMAMPGLAPGSGSEAAGDRETPAASIAVLPFLNMSDDEDTGYFSDGIAEELLNQLTRVEGLRVVSRTSSFRFAGEGADKEHDIRQIGSVLNARYIIEGSVRRVHDDLRVTVQLIDTDDGYHRWSHTFEHKWQDIFALQESMTQAIVREIRPQLPIPPAQNAPASIRASSAQAYEAYLLGRHYWHQRNPDSLATAIGYFEQSLVIEPGFALAYTGLADCYLAMVSYGNLDKAEALAKAEPLLAKALELAPNLAESHLALGNLHSLKTEWSLAEAEYRKSLALNPNLSMSHMFLANVYNDTGRLSEAYDEYRKALLLDPLHATILMNLSQTALKLGLYTRAERYLAQAKALFPTHAYLLGLSAHIHVSSGNRPAALELIRRWQTETAADVGSRAASDELACGMIWIFLEKPAEAEACLIRALDSTAKGSLRARDVMMARTHLAVAESDLGKPELALALAAEARKIGTEASRISPNDEFLAYEMAVAHALLKNDDAAFSALARSISLGRRDPGWMENDRRLDGLRNDDRYAGTIAGVQQEQLVMREKVLADYPE